MPDFAEDQRDKAQLPRLPWLVKNQELSAVPVKLNKLQPGWSEVVIQCVPQFSLSSGTACYPTWIQIHILGQALSPEHHRQGSRIWWQQYFPQGQIFTGLDGTVIWIPAPKLQTRAAWTRSHHLTNPPDRFNFSSSEAFLENCSLNTTTVLKAPEARMASLVYLSCKVWIKHLQEKELSYQGFFVC